ncbi:MAG TPA: alpha/beta fold hydrolase [Actinomycetota bacterium]|nr:alpha/beta fold hydrolase [Actinomycetota bacterium]
MDTSVTSNGHHVDVGDTRLFVEERGDGYPLFLLHGGPGLDHHEFGDYLDSLTDEFRLLLVDQRGHGLSDHVPPETCTLENCARDIVSLARALDLDRYAVLGHSWGAFVALENAVDFPDAAAQSIISSGLPSARYLEKVFEELAKFEPKELRQQVTDSWAVEKDLQTEEQSAASLHDQLPFHFKDPYDPRIAEFEERSKGARYSPEITRYFAADESYGGIELEDRLAEVTHPVLVISGRHDRTCAVEGGEAIAEGIPGAEFVVLENSAHMTYVEENEAYCRAVRGFLSAHGAR